MRVLAFIVPALIWPALVWPALAWAALAWAGPARADTLEQAMNDAAQSNPALAAQRQRLLATREALPQAWSEALPQLSLSASAAVSDQYPTLGPTAGDARREPWSGGASASQLVFASGRVLAATHAARAQIAGAGADYDLVLQSLLLDVATSYANVRQALAVVEARETTVSNLATLFRFAQAQFDVGVVTRTDVAQSQARLAQARTQLVQAQGVLAAAAQTYQRLVGAPPSNLEAPHTAPGLPQTLDAALEAAGTASPALIGARADVEQADANIDVAASSGRLRVTLEANASLNGDFDSTDLETSSNTVGVRFSQPIFQGGAVRSRTRQQRALRSVANLDFADAQRRVQEGVTNAWTGLASARAAVGSAREQVAASELAYQGVRLEQAAGQRATVEVLNQEQDLLDARLALAQADRDLVVAERQMLAQMGALAP